MKKDYDSTAGLADDEEHLSLLSKSFRSPAYLLPGCQLESKAPELAKGTDFLKPFQKDLITMLCSNCNQK